VQTPDDRIEELVAQRNSLTGEVTRLHRAVIDLGDEISRHRNTIAALRLRLDVALS